MFDQIFVFVKSASIYFSSKSWTSTAKLFAMSYLNLFLKIAFIFGPIFFFGEGGQPNVKKKIQNEEPKYFFFKMKNQMNNYL